MTSDSPLETINQFTRSAYFGCLQSQSCALRYVWRMEPRDEDERRRNQSSTCLRLSPPVAVAGSISISPRNTGSIARSHHDHHHHHQQHKHDHNAAYAAALQHFQSIRSTQGAKAEETPTGRERVLLGTADTNPNLKFHPRGAAGRNEDFNDPATGHHRQLVRSLASIINHRPERPQHSRRRSVAC